VRSILLEMPSASAKQLTPEAMEVLCHHKYTANILELRNIIHRLVVTFETDVYSEHHAIQAIHAGTPSSKSERVIEKKSQRSMLPDFKGYVAHAHTSGARSSGEADKGADQPSFIAQRQASYGNTPDGHLKLLHLWPVKLLQAGQPDYDASGLMTRRAAASLSL
jgi:DNA-binding NtrC family response regulator